MAHLVLSLLCRCNRVVMAGMEALIVVYGAFLTYLADPGKDPDRDAKRGVLG